MRNRFGKSATLAIIFVIIALVISAISITSRSRTTEFTKVTPLTSTEKITPAVESEPSEVPLDSEAPVLDGTTVEVEVTPAVTPVTKKKATKVIPVTKPTPVKVTISKGTTVTTKTNSGTQTVTVNTDRVKVAVTVETNSADATLSTESRLPGWKYDENGKFVTPATLLPGWHISPVSNTPVRDGFIEPSLVKPDWVTDFIEPKISWAGWESCTRLKELTTHFVTGGPAYQWEIIGKLKVTGGNFRPVIKGAPLNNKYPLVGPDFTYYIEVSTIRVISVEAGPMDTPSRSSEGNTISGGAQWVPMNWNSSMPWETHYNKLKLIDLSVPEGLCKA